MTRFVLYVKVDIQGRLASLRSSSITEKETTRLIALLVNPLLLHTPEHPIDNTSSKMAPSQKDIKDDLNSSNLTVSESDTTVEPHNSQASGKKSLKEVAKGNPTQLGDPVSLKAETSDHEPTDQDRGAKAKDGDLAGGPNEKRESKL